MHAQCEHGAFLRSLHLEHSPEPTIALEEITKARQCSGRKIAVYGSTAEVTAPSLRQFPLPEAFETSRGKRFVFQFN